MSTPPREWVVMFAKAPVPGTVKTRLIPALGEVWAARLHEAFIADMLEVTLRWASQREARGLARPGLALAVSGQASHAAFERHRQVGALVLEQGQGDLGERLSRVSQALFAQGAQAVLITGSDSPTLSVEHYELALEALRPAAQAQTQAQAQAPQPVATPSPVGSPRVVYGPSRDGGYYLIGLDRHVPEAFADIPWSCSQTLAVSMRRCQRAGCLLALTPFWYDVDTVDDLMFLSNHLQTYLTTLPAAQGLYLQTLQRLAELRDEGVLDGDDGDVC